MTATADLPDIPDIPDITLPADLRLSDGRFGSGPSRVRPAAVDALAATGTAYLGTSHRQATVKSVVRAVRDGVADLFALPDDYEVLLGLGGSTGFWDAAATSLVEQRSRHLVFGEFSAKFATVTRGAPHLDEPEVIESAPGATPTTADDCGRDAYCYPQNETSTGVCVPVHRPDTGDGLVVVDATSAAGGLRVEPTRFDVYYFAPQKCFGSDGGLWIACASPAAVARIERVTARADRWIPATLDLGIALENSRLDQTYNTPALATLFLLRHTLDWMLGHGGLEWSAGRCDANAAVVYDWAEAHERATPYVEDPDARSHVTATIDFDESVDAASVARVLRANGIVDVEPYRKLGRNQLRIALFPAIGSDELEVLTRAVDHVIAALA